MKKYVADNLDLIRKIISLARNLNQKGYLAAADGNISYRLDNSNILMTPSGVSKMLIEPEDFALINIDGIVLEGNPSSERLMHLQVYKNNLKSVCVFHAHPPTAVAYSIANPDAKELPLESMPEVILGVGGVPIVPYALPGSAELAKGVGEGSKQSKSLIMARHGVVSHGDSLEEAYHGVERIEHSAEILLRASQFGGITNLPQEEIIKLRELRQKIGARNL